MSRIESLRGTTPAEIFSSGLENIAEIEAVAVSVRWSDGSVSVGWSNVETDSLARMILMLDEAQRRRTIAEGEL